MPTPGHWMEIAEGGSIIDRSVDSDHPCIQASQVDGAIWCNAPSPLPQVPPISLIGRRLTPTSSLATMVFDPSLPIVCICTGQTNPPSTVLLSQMWLKYSSCKNGIELP
uniref:Uncharacterized protein n=1 Tax=Eutreptiella gymnastica TaxID=73025 RepID=A0A7S1NKC1_9EUGL